MVLIIVMLFGTVLLNNFNSVSAEEVKPACYCIPGDCPHMDSWGGCCRLDKGGCYSKCVGNTCYLLCQDTPENYYEDGFLECHTQCGASAACAGWTRGNPYSCESGTRKTAMWKGVGKIMVALVMKDPRKIPKYPSEASHSVKATNASTNPMQRLKRGSN